MFRIVLTLIAVFVSLQGYAAEAYKGPIALCPTKDGKFIYVVNQDSHEIAVLNTAENKIVKTIVLESDFFPRGAVLSADEKTLYITGGGYKGRVLAFDVESGIITKTAIAGHTPTAVVLTPSGTKLFVCNQFTDDVSEYSLPELILTRTIKVAREPSAAVVTKDEKHVLVANLLPNVPANYIPDPVTGVVPNASIYVAAEITVIDITSGKTRAINNLSNGCGILQGMCISPDGRYVYVTTTLARFQVRTTHVDRGWINTSGIVVIDTTQLDNEDGGFVETVLIDGMVIGAANPWGIATSADGKTIYVAVAGTSELITVDAVEMHKRIETSPKKGKQNYGYGYLSHYSFGGIGIWDNLAFLDGAKKRIPLPGKGARALEVAGNNIYVGMYFSDSLQKLDKTQLHPTEIALGAVPTWTPERRGEIWWHDATLCAGHWQSCASCHPDARTDGHNWDLLNDGQDNPKSTKSLLLSHQTPPSMWQGVRDDPNRDGWNTETMGLQCIRTGFRFVQFVEPDEAKCQDIDVYLRALKPVPSPYLVEGKLSERAKRGKIIFEDRSVGCTKCHPAPLFTDMKPHDVKSKSYYDNTSSFYTPTLVEVWRTAPYLHDGRYVNMRDVFKHGRHGDVAGDVNGLTDEQIDDLVEYILSL